MGLSIAHSTSESENLTDIHGLMLIRAFRYTGTWLKFIPGVAVPGISLYALLKCIPYCSQPK